MRRWGIRLLVLALLAGAVVVLRATVLAPEPVPVRTWVVERGLVESTITNSKAGTIEARRRAKLSPGISGIVSELLVHRGDTVAAGQVLLRLDDATWAADLALAQRALDVATTMHRKAAINTERARRELDRYLELKDEELVSADQLDALDSAWNLATAESDVAAAEVERARAAVAVAQAELDKTVLRAPFDAIVAEVETELGEWVTPSVPLVSAPHLVDAIDPSSLYVAAPMDEVDAGLLAPGLPVRVTIDSHPGRSFDASVVRVAPYVLDVEQQNRTVEIEVELLDEAFSRTLLPGTSADVEVVLDVRDGVLRIPTYALAEGGRVLVVEDGVLVERHVEVGVRNWDFVEVVAGLAAGDPVVTSLDRTDVEPGARVRVESSLGGAAMSTRTGGSPAAPGAGAASAPAGGGSG